MSFLYVAKKPKIPENDISKSSSELLLGWSRNASSGEKRCVTSLITVVSETSYEPEKHNYLR